MRTIECVELTIGRSKVTVARDIAERWIEKNIRCWNDKYDSVYWAVNTVSFPTVVTGEGMEEPEFGEVTVSFFIDGDDAGEEHDLLIEYTYAEVFVKDERFR